MPRDLSFEPFRSFYAEGGYTGSRAANKRLDMALWGSQNFDDGGAVKPLLAAGGPQFLNWVRKLIDVAAPTERTAIKRADDFAKATGNETYIVGRERGMPDLSDSIQSLGGPKSTPIPLGYGKYLQDHASEPVFSAHPHPTATPAPSWGDMNVWLNHPQMPEIAAAKEADPFKPMARQSMWIKGRYGGDDNLAYVAPAPSSQGERFGLGNRIEDLFMRQKMADPLDRRELNRLAADILPNEAKRLLNNSTPEERARLIWGVSQAHHYNQLSKEAPQLMFDPNMLIHDKLPYTAGEAWPEYLDALSKRGLGYAEGGQIPADESRPMPPFQLAYGSQFFNEGGPVLHHAVDSTIDALNRMGTRR